MQIRPNFQNSHKRSNKTFENKANGEILTIKTPSFPVLKYFLPV